MPKKKSDIILPDNKIVVPEKEKAEVISAMIQIPIVFKSTDKIDSIIEKMDKSIVEERQKAITAIGKLLGVEVKWEE